MELYGLKKLWKVTLSKKAQKQKNKLPMKFQNMVIALKISLEKGGPIQKEWPNFSALDRKKTRYHCHLNKKGHPTYVAVWDIVDRKIQLMEIKYVGTREKAPYK